MKRTLALFGALIAVVLFAGCGISSTQVYPNAVGLKYSEGSWGGRDFMNIVNPGQVNRYWNDKVFQLPIGQRNFIISKEKGSDVEGVISVPARGGNLIDFEINTTLKLNTRTDDIRDFEGGTVRRFFEDLCRGYGCQLNDDGNITEGWRKMLREKYYTSLVSAFKDEARNFTPDDIVANREGVQTTLREAAAKSFQTYLKRQAGGDYFCGPTFDRNSRSKPGDEGYCPPVEVSIISADYNNPAVRQSREAVKVAEDQNSARDKIRDSIQDPNYLRYLEIQAMSECARNAQATCVFTSGAPVGVPIR